MGAADYNNASVIFFVSYVGELHRRVPHDVIYRSHLCMVTIAFEIPSNLLLKKVREGIHDSNTCGS